MSLIEIFKDINMKYRNHKDNSVFGIHNNDFHKNLDENLRGAIPKSILGRNYKPSLSLGKGNWANVPWIAIFDQTITTTAQKGFYIVYLFSEDYKRVYLSLNQGWNYFSKKSPLKKAKLEAKTVVEFWRENLELISENESFNIKEINLSDGVNGTSPRGKGYGYTNIISKCYVIEELTEEDELMLHGDLNDMITVLKELKSKLVKSKDPVADTVNFILNDQELSDIAKENENSKVKKVENQKELTLTDKAFNPSTKITAAKGPISPIKKDYISSAKTNQKTGIEGEKLVLKYEEKRLKENPLLNHLCDEVEWVANTQGDGLGYDIVSYNLNSDKRARKILIEKIFIEVKTTTGNIDTPIYMSNNEYRVALEKEGQYYIYKVFNYKEIPELKIIKDPINSIATQEVVNYLVTFKEPEV